MHAGEREHGHVQASTPVSAACAETLVENVRRDRRRKIATATIFNRILFFLRGFSTVFIHRAQLYSPSSHERMYMDDEQWLQGGSYVNESDAGAAGLLGAYQQRTRYSSLLAACIACAWSSRSEENMMIGGMELRGY